MLEFFLYFKLATFLTFVPMILAIVLPRFMCTKCDKRNNCDTTSPFLIMSCAIFVALLFFSYGSTKEITVTNYDKIFKALEENKNHESLRILIDEALSKKGFISELDMDKFNDALKEVKQEKVLEAREETKEKIANKISNLDGQ